MEKSYLFYTDEGYTTAPNDEELDSLQILGSESGRTLDAALSELYSNNPWIIKNGFDADRIKSHVVVSDAFMRSVKIVTDYLLSANGDESEKHDGTLPDIPKITREELHKSIKLLHENS